MGGNPFARYITRFRLIFMDGNECYQDTPLWKVGSRVICRDRRKFTDGKTATIVGSDGMGGYTLEFDEQLLNAYQLETRQYWDLEPVVLKP